MVSMEEEKREFELERKKEVEEEEDLMQMTESACTLTPEQPQAMGDKALFDLSGLHLAKMSSNLNEAGDGNVGFKSVLESLMKVQKKLPDMDSRKRKQASSGQQHESLSRSLSSTSSDQQSIEDRLKGCVKFTICEGLRKMVAKLKTDAFDGIIQKLPDLQNDNVLWADVDIRDTDVTDALQGLLEALPSASQNKQTEETIKTLNELKDLWDKSWQFLQDNNSKCSELSVANDEFVSRFTENFDQIEVLGTGGFAVVFEARHKLDEAKYAIKRIALKNSAGAKERVMREVKALATLNCRNIVRYYTSWTELPPQGWQEEKDKPLKISDSPETVNTDEKDDTSGDNSGENPSGAPSDNSEGNVQKLYLYIKTELCKRETLKDLLTQKKVCNMAMRFFHQITSAVEYLHSSDLMHRDLKPANIFFSLDGVIKMGDFGLARTYKERNHRSKGFSPNVGTPLYMSPEMKDKMPYSQKVDIYALGIIMFELLHPFDSDSERIYVLPKVRERNFPESFLRDNLNECNLIEQLVSLNPDHRPSAKDILGNDLLWEYEKAGVQLPNSTTVADQV